MSDKEKKKITRHTELDVYQKAFTAAMQIFELSKKFPAEERYSLTDQIRRSSRSVCANIAEGYRKSRYPNLFVLKMTDADGEVAETQVHLDFGRDCGYLDVASREELVAGYEEVG